MVASSSPSRVAYLQSLWRQGLWGQWVVAFYSAAGLFVFVRDDFWRPSDEEKWALINLIPSLTFSQWMAGALLIVLAWLFEASYRIQVQTGVMIASMQPKRSPAEERKYRATRATLPVTLDATFTYAKASIRWLGDIREKAGLLDAGQYSHAVAIASSPRPDTAMIAALGDSVEHLDADVGEYIRALLSKIQIHRARIMSLEEHFEMHASQRSTRVGVRQEVDQYIADSVELAALVRQLFPYARGASDGPIAPLDIYVLGATFRECQLEEIRDVEAWNILTTPYLRNPGEPPQYLYAPPDEMRF